MNRSGAFSSLKCGVDVLIIGAGATGLGIAVDAVTRGYSTALIEAGDFAQATSSRSTKLIHGGVRYLAGGQIDLVYEALHERAIMRRNAPHLVKPLPFLLPVYRHWQLPYYAAGLLLYDFMSGKSTMGPTRVLGTRSTAVYCPGLTKSKLVGSILYHDSQFNDARLALSLARTAVDYGATVLNYTRVERLIYSGSKITGAVARDVETGEESEINARVVINATGIFTDKIRKLDQPEIPNLVSVSRGTHIVVRGAVLGKHAIMVPKTRDGRVVFAIPWQGRVVIGTTDLAASQPELEPGHTEDEIDFLLATVEPYLEQTLTRVDILAVFSGLRPLVTGKATTTSNLSREHHIEVSPSGLISIAGGKWTTYRLMAEDTLNTAIRNKMIAYSACITKMIPLHGATLQVADVDSYFSEYGTDIGAIQSLIETDPLLARPLDRNLPYCFAHILYAVRFEMARTLEDVLSRRTRSLLLDPRAALRAAPEVAAIVARELQRNSQWAAQEVHHFKQLCEKYYLPTR